MTWHSILYLSATVAAAIFAAWKGGLPERIAIAIAIIATVASAFVLSPTYPRFAVVPVKLMIVDALTFVAFAALALRADRFWPMAVAGFQGSAVVLHLCRIVRPDILPWGYVTGILGASDINVVLILIGIYNHWRRVKNNGVDQIRSR